MYRASAELRAEPPYAEPPYAELRAELRVVPPQSFAQSLREVLIELRVSNSTSEAIFYTIIKKKATEILFRVY